MEDIKEILHKTFYYAKACINYKTKELNFLILPVYITIENIIDTGTLYELTFSCKEREFEKNQNKIHIPKNKVEFMSKSNCGIFILNESLKFVEDNLSSWIKEKQLELFDWEKKEKEKITKKFSERLNVYLEALKMLN